LLRCADVVACGAAKVFCASGSVEQAELALALRFLEDRSFATRPAVVAVETFSTRLQPPATKDVPDDEWVDLSVGDAAADSKKKIKRAFCEPSNVAVNPPLALMAFLLQNAVAVTDVHIARGPDNGGDVTYTAATLEKMVADFKSGALHPGDLKPALTKALDSSIITAAAAPFAHDAATKAADKVLKAHAKKKAKKK